MKRRIKTGLAMMMTALLLSGCGGSRIPLAEVFQQEELEQQTAQIVE